MLNVVVFQGPRGSCLLIEQQLEAQRGRIEKAEAEAQQRPQKRAENSERHVCESYDAGTQRRTDDRNGTNMARCRCKLAIRANPADVTGKHKEVLGGASREPRKSHMAGVPSQGDALKGVGLLPVFSLHGKLCFHELLSTLLLFRSFTLAGTASGRCEELSWPYKIHGVCQAA